TPASRRSDAHQRASVSAQLCVRSPGGRSSSGRGAAHPWASGDRDHGALHAHRRPRAARGDDAPPDQRLPGFGGIGRMNALDPLIEGYLSYLRDVGRKAPRTVIDVRCTLKRAADAFASRRPEVSLWKLTLEDYLHWFEVERELGRSEGSLAKDASHLRGLLEYAWRSGRSERNVLDGLNLHARVKQRAPN